MDTILLNASPRETGKKGTKAVRREDRVPCVLYGPHQDPVHFAVERLDLRPLIHTTVTYRVLVQMDGDEHEAILKDVVYHPITEAPLHLDFQALTKGEKITVTIPVHLDGAAPGVKAGGVLSQPLYDLEIRCVPAKIPGQINVDVSTLEVGDSLHVSDLSLGDDIEVLTEPGRTIVTVTVPRAVEEPEPAEGLELLEGILPEGEEAAEAGEPEEGEAPEEA
ncbi:MAG: 50S ribosomal protein L25 [Rubricoccaceae bacterium]|nr:50S ribosomal protein L25 [Rubricoccaceae bacterium]